MRHLIPTTILCCFLLAGFLLKLNQPVPEVVEEPHIPGALRALDFWFNSRAFPNGKINMASYSNAFKQHRAQSVSTNKTAAGSSTWKALGPHNVGGRTLALAFNPANSNTIWAGSASGGLWRSHSGGEGVNAWHNIPIGFPVLGVAAIAVHPSDSNTLYIGTGEVYNYQNTGTRLSIRVTRGTYGTGIFKSTDNGASWTHSLNWAYDDMRGVQHIVVNPLNPNAVWAATTEGVFRSYDAGATWTNIHPILMATDILFHPADTNIVMVSCGGFATTGHGLYRSMNGGQTFVKMTNGTPGTFSGKTLLGVTGSAPYEFFASFADDFSGIGIYKTVDTGTTWTVVNDTVDYPVWQGWYSHDVEVNPSDRNEVLACGLDLYRSTNGGYLLSQVSAWNLWQLGVATPIGGPEGPAQFVHGDIHRIYYHPTNHDTVYFVTDGGIFRTKDGASTFEGLNGMYQTTQFYANFASSHQDSNFAVGGLQDNTTVVYEGNGAWRKEIGGDGCSAAINPNDDNIVYGSYQYLGMLKSTDRGVNWSQLSPPQTSAENFAAPYVLCPDNPNTIYAGGSTLLKSVNAGFTWVASNGSNSIYQFQPILKIATDPNDCDLVFVSITPSGSNLAKIFKSTNGGSSWTDHTGSLPNRYLMDIAVHPSDQSEVWVTVGGYGTSHVYKSMNGGVSWFAKDNGLPDLPTNSVEIDPITGVIYVGNDLGVYYSEDGGNNWQPYATGMPEAAIVMDLNISQANNALRAATHGSGVWEVGLYQPPVVYRPAKDPLPLTVYPNPTAGSFSISGLPEKDGNSCEIWDAAGKRVYSGDIVENTKVNLTGQEPGVYFVKIGEEVRKVVLQ